MSPVVSKQENIKYEGLSNDTKLKYLYLLGMIVMLKLWIVDIKINNSLETALISFIIPLFYKFFLKKGNKKEVVLIPLFIGVGHLYSHFYKFIGINMIFIESFVLLTIFYIIKDKEKHKLIQILAVILIFILAFNAHKDFNRDRLIQDRNLENQIKDRLEVIGNSQEITVENLQKIKKLSIWAMDNVENLKGIENLSNLESLNIGNANQICDLEPIGLLPNLKELVISRGELRDISNIKNLSQLKSLTLGYLKIKENQYLNNLDKLKSLSLEEVEIKDLYLVKELECLEELELNDCTIDSIKGIERLTNLKKLILDETNINDIERIEELKSLEEVTLIDCEVNDLELLKELPNIKKVDIKSKSFVPVYP